MRGTIRCSSRPSGSTRLKGRLGRRQSARARKRRASGDDNPGAGYGRRGAISSLPSSINRWSQWLSASSAASRLACRRRHTPTARRRRTGTWLSSHRSHRARWPPHHPWPGSRFGRKPTYGEGHSRDTRNQTRNAMNHRKTSCISSAHQGIARFDWGETGPPS